ncbi:hypothetical protein PG984_013329 [Apiospora sp. TS-2023a]
MEEEPSISSLARCCDVELQSLSKALQETQDVRFGTLDEILTRFRMWANSIGAFQASSSLTSLDARLKHSVAMSEAVRDALSDLSESAVQARYITQGRRRDLSNVATATSPMIVRDYLLPTDDDPDFPSETVALGKTELEELLRGLQLTTKGLFRLSVLIRRERLRDRIPPSLNLIPDELDLGIRHVRDSFPKTKDQSLMWLSQRLGEAISQRKAIIRSRQEEGHHQKGKGVASVSMADKSETIPTMPTTISEMSLDPEGAASFMSSRNQYSSATTITSIFENGESDELRVPRLTSLMFRGVKLEYNMRLTCPFCLTTRSFSSDGQWRSHVFADLQPYLCNDWVPPQGIEDNTRAFFRHLGKHHQFLALSTRVQMSIDDLIVIDGSSGSSASSTTGDAVDIIESPEAGRNSPEAGNVLVLSGNTAHDIGVELSPIIGEPASADRPVSATSAVALHKPGVSPTIGVWGKTPASQEQFAFTDIRPDEELLQTFQNELQKLEHLFVRSSLPQHGVHCRFSYVGKTRESARPAIVILGTKEDLKKIRKQKLHKEIDPRFEIVYAEAPDLKY